MNGKKMVIKICVNVVGIGAYKLNRIPIIFGISSETVNTFLKIPLLKYMISKWVDYNEFINMKKIKRIAKKHNCPMTWSVVPFKYGLHSPRKSFKHACPEAYKFLTQCIKDGDEIIQEGTMYSAEEFTDSMNKNAQYKRINKGWELIQDIFPQTKKIFQAPKWKANQDTIQALHALGFEGILGGNLLSLNPAPLKSTYQIQINKTGFNEDLFSANIPINITIKVGDKEAIQKLATWFDFIKLMEKSEFVLCSEVLK